MKHPPRLSKAQRYIPSVLTTLALKLVVACSLTAPTATHARAPRPTATSSAPAPRATATPTQAPTLAPFRAERGETWVLKGFAVGKKAGNERGNYVMADVILLDNGTYRMYYGYSLERIFTGHVATAHEPPSIKYAESKDGINWTVRGTVLKGDPDPKSREHIISGPRILRLPDGRYRMYYFCSQQQREGEQPKLHIRSAISTDGINFEREGVRIDISPYDNSTGLRLAAHGTFFIASDGTYVAIFSGDFTTEQGASDLKIATSKNGLTFTNFKTLYKDWHDPIVVKVAGGYRMYAAFLLDTYGTAFSPDGINWPSQMTEIILVDPKGNRLTPKDSYVGDLGAVVLPDGKIRLYANYGVPTNIVYFEKQSIAPTNPKQPPAPSAIPTLQSSDQCSNGYMTFAINTHDIRYVSKSADTILRLVGIFEKYNVRGDFYLTAPLVELYSKQRPDVIARLRDSQMTISYHIRPPHPAYPGFEARLKTLDDETLEQTLRDYETYRLDLATGNVDKSQPGGYKYVAQVFGRNPVVVSPMSSDRRIRSTLERIYAGMGAKMVVAYHEEGTDISNPFVYKQGLLQRPSDFSITRIKMENGRQNFWWNLIFTPHGDAYNPTKMLQTQLEQWNAPRPPFITSLIHEDNFYSSGTAPWNSFFYDSNGKPLSPPYNLNAPDKSRPRTQEQSEALFKAYEELVAYAAKNLCVVTSEDIVALASGKMVFEAAGAPKEVIPSSIAGGVLLFTIGMHIEPLGTTHQGFPGGPPGVDYRNKKLFQTHVEDIRTVARMVEAHGGRMTIQAQSPFTDVAIKTGNTILSDLAARGHEIGLHFHEDAHLGKNPEALPVQRWCAVMKEEIALIQQASGVREIRYWSGGNLYPDLYQAAVCAGLEVNSDWKNPKTQTTDTLLVGINPWRPAGGVSKTGDVNTFARHDPNGKIIFLPEGIYSRTDFAHMRQSMTDEEYFVFLKESLEQSLQAAQPGKVNVFHFTIHPGEFKGDAKNPFAVIDKFLTTVVDPQVQAGKVKWATLSQMADAFKSWEMMHPSISPK